MAKKRKIREKLLQAPGMMADVMQAMTSFTSGVFNASIMGSGMGRDSVIGKGNGKKQVKSTGRNIGSAHITPTKTTQSPGRSGGNQR